MANTAVQQKEKLLPIVTMKDGINNISIQKVSEENREKADPLPVVISVSNSVRIVSTENTADTCRKDRLNEAKETLNNLNRNNWRTITTKMVQLKIDSKQMLEEIAEEIHQRALNNSNLAKEYAALCSVLIRNQSFKRSLKRLNVTLMQVLLPKCYDLFYSYKRNRNERLSEGEQTATLSAKENADLLANSIFISELYNRGAIPESICWHFILSLLNENGNAQIHCLAEILKLAGTKLCKKYSLSRVVGHLLLLLNEAHREEAMSSKLQSLIHHVKTMHAKFWVHRVPDRAFKKNLRSTNGNLLKSNKTDSEKKLYESSLMAECTLKDCRDFLNGFVNRKGSNKVKRLMSPALAALLKTDQLDFTVNMIVTAVDEKSPRIRTRAGKLLANMAKERLLAKRVVYLGFDTVRKDKAKFRHLLSSLEAEYTRQLNIDQTFNIRRTFTS